MELTILMPCLNEAETIEACIRKANQYLSGNNVFGEVLIADNGSTDGSQAMATALGARLVAIPTKGYGSALIGGINAAQGKYIIMGDSDDSYDFSHLELYVAKLRQGADLVMGNRFKGGIKKGAMPFLHKYLGNPVLSFVGRLFFGTHIGDFHCGLRGFSKEAAMKMDLRCEGMEFASEMVVKATLLKLKIEEVSTILYPDGRSRPPHLKTWRDGWRHLRFLFMYSPKWLFLYPGIILMVLGTIFSIRLFFKPIVFLGIGLDVHTLLYSFSMLLIGFQGVSFFMFSKIYAIQQGLLPKSDNINTFSRYFNLELGLIIGVVLIILGFVFSFYALNIWNQSHFGSLDNKNVLRMVIAASSCLVLGFQVILYSFFFSILGLKSK